MNSHPFTGRRGKGSKKTLTPVFVLNEKVLFEKTCETYFMLFQLNTLHKYYQLKFNDDQYVHLFKSLSENLPAMDALKQTVHQIQPGPVDLYLGYNRAPFSELQKKVFVVIAELIYKENINPYKFDKTEFLLLVEQKYCLAEENAYLSKRLSFQIGSIKKNFYDFCCMTERFK